MPCLVANDRSRACGTPAYTLKDYSVVAREPGKTQVLEALDRWFKANRKRLATHGLRIVVQRSDVPVSKPSIRADVDTDRAVATLILWQTGECDTTILDVGTGEPLVVEHSMIRNDQELVDTLESFCR